MNASLGLSVSLNPQAMLAQQAHWLACLNGQIGTDAEQALRDALTRAMQALDLDVICDQAGNLLGCLRSRSDGGRQPPVMMGCHLDVAAPLGGALGALAGLAVLRAYREAGQLPLRTLTVAAFTHTLGGQLPPELVGAQVFAGHRPVNDSLAAHLTRLGWQGAHPPGEVTPYEYLEWQATVQPLAPATLALVEQLQAVSSLHLRLTGLSDEAADPTWQSLVRQVVTPLSHSWGVRATFLPDPSPNALHPAVYDWRLNWLGTDDALLQQAVEAFVPQAKAWAHARGVTLAVTPLDSCDTAAIDAPLSQAIRDAAHRQGLSVMSTTCPAGWETLALARQAPCALVRSSPEQLVDATEVLLKVVRQRAGVLPPPQLRRSPQCRSGHRAHGATTGATPNGRSHDDRVAWEEDAHGLQTV